MAPPLNRIAVKSVNRIVIVPTASIIRLEAEDNYVRLWADRPYLHKETLTGLMERLDPREFLRIHRSHAVNVRAVRELRPLLHGEYQVVLDNGTELTSGRSFRSAIQTMFGLN
jgi:two-component system LytT family response regulator